MPQLITHHTAVGYYRGRTKECKQSIGRNALETQTQREQTSEGSGTEEDSNR